MKGRKWTLEEEATLRAMAKERKTPMEIGSALDRTATAVLIRSQLIGIKLPTRVRRPDL